ncbi:adenine phosphoribosyltransferase [Erysipelothrix aquatica]|uniref:adenine phosphoribosyltransferase n=1 Tax=Erysipelothrix aquatica TaxID=2683714 RepID=UPI001357AAEA|nr:adenine phosphoribosyltransferase [Erysipelothrix aquatica]
MELKNYIATIEDFPKPGIKFRDITPLMANGEAFAEATRRFTEFAKKVGADVIVGPESRGFIFGCPVAYNLEVGFIPVRKPGKLPRETVSYAYDLEYGSNELHIHKDGIKPGQKVLIIDDLLATGGTIEASVALVRELGGEVVGCGFLIELEELEGRKKLEGIEVFAMMQY